MRVKRAGWIAAALVAIIVWASACTTERPPPAGDPPPVGPTATPPPPAATPGPPAAAAQPPAVLVGAGDIATCGADGDERTAALLDRLPGTVYTLGDNVYNDGTPSQFARCYGRSWGRHKARTRPTAGNHDHHTPGAGGYFGYFGAAAGPRGRGWYSYRAGAWHVVVLNSNCAAIAGGCAVGSPQERWLRRDLAANPARCTLAMWHHPLFTSGRNHGPTTAVRPLFQALYDAGAEIVLAGHNHQYERFAPQNPSGRRDDARGIRTFVVGTGGASHYRFRAPARNSEVRNDDAHGVLRLDLRAGSYDWRFVPVAGAGFTDAGRGTCH